MSVYTYEASILCPSSEPQNYVRVRGLKIMSVFRSYTLCPCAGPLNYVLIQSLKLCPGAVGAGGGSSARGAGVGNRFVTETEVHAMVTFWWDQENEMDEIYGKCKHCDKKHASAEYPNYGQKRTRNSCDFVTCSSLHDTCNYIARDAKRAVTENTELAFTTRISNDQYSNQSGGHWITVAYSITKKTKNRI